MTLWTNATKGLNRERPNRALVRRAEVGPPRRTLSGLDAAHSAALHNGRIQCTPLKVGGLCYCCFHLKMYAFSRLQILNDLDKIVSFRVAGRPKHTHETLWINVDSLS